MAETFWTIDPKTLREVITDRPTYEAALATATDLDRIFLLRIDNRLEEAFALGDSIGMSSGPNFRLCLLTAHVLQWMDEFDDALAMIEFATALAPTNRAVALCFQHEGKCYFDAGEYEEALDAFEEALELRRESDAAADLIQSSQQAIDRCCELLGIDGGS